MDFSNREELGRWKWTARGLSPASATCELCDVGRSFNLRRLHFLTCEMGIIYLVPRFHRHPSIASTAQA